MTASPTDSHLTDINCVDRHLRDRGDQTASIWAADEPGVYRHIS